MNIYMKFADVYLDVYLSLSVENIFLQQVFEL